MPKLARFRARTGSPTAGENNPGSPSALGSLQATLLHVDMDSFFVSVELLERPELIGEPVIVGGQRDQRGIVASASYEARKFGIHSAMPLRKAARLCPQAIFLDGHPELYGQWSDRVAEILARYSPVVEMASVDEAYLDLAGTERLHGPPFAAAHSLLRCIAKETGLPCSGGLARTRIVAKVASEQAKPKGLLWIPAGAELAFLAPLSVRRIPGIGPVTEKGLRQLGIETTGQLAEIPQKQLEEKFGRWGTALYRKARGEDAWEFVVDAEPKSISHDNTFGEDTDDRSKIESMLSRLVQKAGKRLRDSGLYAQTVELRLRDSQFRTITRSRSLPEPFQVDVVILKTAQTLFHAAWRDGRKLRLVGVGLSGFSQGPGQLDLLDEESRVKRENLARVTDRLRDRFGFTKIQLGGSLLPPGKS